MKAMVVRVALMAAATAAAFAGGLLAVSRHLLVPAFVLLTVLLPTTTALAQATPAAAATAGSAAGTAAATAPPAADAADDDMDIQPVQPDFWVINQPTTLRLPAHSFAFRVAHRFTRSLNQDSFRSSLSDAFGLDSGAQIGLELRFAPFKGAQVGVYRTNDKTIQFQGSYNLLQQRDSVPIGLSAVVGVEGTENFTGTYAPSVAASVSRTFGEVLAVYAVPTWVHNTNPEPTELVSQSDTFVLGLGARVHVHRGLSFVVESSPRLSGYKGGIGQATPNYQAGRTLTAFAIEERVGGHVFQINFSNAFATTPANIARGAAPGKTNWYLGFNISRKFY